MGVALITYLQQGGRYRTSNGRTGLNTGCIETLTFRIGLNTSHVLADFKYYRPIPSVPTGTEKSFLFYFIFFSFVIFEFL